jgi:hypothetical protein
MTIALPDELIVRVECQEGPTCLVASLLIALDITVEGQYYFGALVGLTDAHGVARTSRDALVRHFNDDRSQFPMDYKVPLELCDHAGVVRLEAGSDFASRAQAAITAPTTRAEARELWKRASNASVVPASRSVNFTSTGIVTITLRTSAA